MTSPRPHKDKKPSYSGDYMDVGKSAEAIVMAWLSSQPWCQSVQDVRDEPQMRTDDVDVLVTPSTAPVSDTIRKLIRNHDPLLIEIKSDKYIGRTDNMLFETYRIYHDNPPNRATTAGWSARSTAHVIIWYGSSVHKLYIIRLDDMQRAFQTYTRDARRSIRSRFIATDKSKTTHNVYIPIKYVADAVHIVDLQSNT